MDPVRHAVEVEGKGAGEILINSIDRDGLMEGYDLELIRRVSDAVGIPVVACGGAGNIGHLRDAIKLGGASAAAAGSMFVFQGPLRGVLISYPSPQELKELFGGIKVNSEYRICTRCVMDTSDPDIEFDENGVCNHCHNHDRMVREYVISGEAGLNHLEQVSEKIRQEGKGKSYDCVIGVSGGVDSTFVAYKAKELGLRPLAVHLDNGWDSELAVKNIEQTLKVLGIDLYTDVLDWEEFKDLQVAFLQSIHP